MSPNHSTHFTCSQQIRKALEMQPTGMYRADLLEACDYSGKNDANFGAVLNAMVQANDVLDHMEESGKHRYFSPKAYVPVSAPIQAAAPEAKPVRIILAGERRRILAERIRACGHPVTVNHVYDFGLYNQKPIIYQDLKQLVDEEVLERKDLPGDERLLQAHWWFRGETWPELVKHTAAVTAAQPESGVIPGARGGMKGEQLQNAVEQFSRQDRPPIGETSQSISIRRLNPAFASWLMGWPWWWTHPEPISFAPSEMALYRSRQRQLLESLTEDLG